MKSNCYLDATKDINDQDRMARAISEMYQDVQNSQYILNIVKDKLQHGSWTVLGWFNFADELSLNTYFKMLTHFNLPLEHSVEIKILKTITDDGEDMKLFLQRAKLYREQYEERQRASEEGRNHYVNFLKACM